MTFVNTLKTFAKNNRAATGIFCVGFILKLLVIVLNSDSSMPGNLRLLNYIGWFLIFIALFILFLKKKKVLLGNVVLFILLLFILEVVCFFMLGMPSAENKKFTSSSESEEHISKQIGPVPYGDSIYHHLKLNGNDTVFDVRATIDHNSLRVTPNHSLKHDKFALFFGCSIAYGEGLEDDQTLPYQFQENSGEYDAYNFAYSGYGTNQMLARLEFQNLSEIVDEDDGIALYIFFWDHIYRAIGTMDRYTSWVSNAPYYTFENNVLVRKKTFKSGRYIVSKFYEWIYQKNITKKFGISFPSQLRDEHFDLVTEMVLKSKQTYEKQFGNDSFYLVIYPSYIAYTDEQMNMFKSYLDKKGINYFDLNNFITYAPEYTFDGDPHPNAETNRIISIELLNRIKNKNFN